MNWEQMRKKILKRDNYRCQNCCIRGSNLDVHHIIPRDQGGLDSLQNLVTLCRKCHKITECKEITKENELKKKVLFKINEDLFYDLKHISIYQDVTMNFILEDGARLYFEKYKELLK